MTTSSIWDSAYAPGAAPAWELGRPQAAVQRLADRGLLSGRLLDAGCGTGENVLLAAAEGATATGVDISARAVAMAREKAAERGLAARFEVADVMSLDQLGMTFDVVIDSGVFHMFGDEDRDRYVTSLASVLAPGGYLYLICASGRQPEAGWPRRSSQDELRAVFSDGWAFDGIEEDVYEVDTAMGTMDVPSWLAAIRRA